MTTEAEALQTNCPKCGNLLTSFSYEEEKDWACTVTLGGAGLEYDSYTHDIFEQKFMCDDCGELITTDETTALAILIRNVSREEEHDEQDAQASV